ncbi:hypothetical protein [Embleya hyalina]|uniref:Uncharacterized protein n=1 Tax=Embleya hyalina TaxID=516124 RepID=A0A401YY47_9ACTN|nr:hypothetical protein [Embleya hyalina]GCD99503.1 hypothetical protein EHYA_07225 [Embleya hyalina]
MSNNAPGPWGPQQPGPGQWGPQPGPPGPFGSGPYGGAPPPQPPRTGNVGLAVAAGVVAMLVGAGVYGVIVKSLDVQSTWFGVGVAALIALAVGRVGGADPVLPVVATVLALLGVVLGQLTALTLSGADELDISVLDVLTDYGSDLMRGWKDGLEFFDFLVFGFAGFAAFGITKSIGER